MHIERELLPVLRKDLGTGKIIILYGPRQVGKTTLVRELIKDEPESAYFLCDEPDVRAAFADKTSTELKALIGSAKVVVIDEAQRVENIGITLKLLHDVHPDIRVIATGSSSFDLANKLVEPLTGRAITRVLYPISYREYARAKGDLEARRLLAARLVFGMYPEVVTSDDPEAAIRRIAAGNLFKDVFAHEGIRKPVVVEQLTALLAHQVGSEVSLNELAQRLGVSRSTVSAYVRLLEQAFIVYRLPALGRNRRNEVTKFSKIYFYDNGVRNAMIGAFSPAEARTDSGALFESFFIAERKKLSEYAERLTSHYFWRTKDGSEIDLVEETGGALEAFECKWGGGSFSSRAWESAHPNAPVHAVRKDTVEGFL